MCVICVTKDVGYPSSYRRTQGIEVEIGIRVELKKTMKLKNMEGEISNGSDIPDTDSVPKLMLVQEGREERETDSRGILSKLVH